MGCHIFRSYSTMCHPKERSGYMPDKDVRANTYFEDPEHCADLLNGFGFQGKQYVLPEHIQIRNQNNALPNTKDKSKETISIYRDVVVEANILCESSDSIKDIAHHGKYIQMKTAIITLENQSDIHYAMPVRVMSGDSANYHNQWRKIAKKHKKNKDLKGMEFLSGFAKEDKLTPLSTIVVYFGNEPWNGPRCLKDMLDLEGLPQEMLDIIADYPLNILEVRRYLDYENFQTDFQLVCGFLQRDKDSASLDSYVKTHTAEFQDLSEETFQLINNYSNSNYLIKTKETYQTETGGINMCKAIEDLILQGEERGLERGIESIIKICQEFGVTADLTLQRIITDFSLDEAKAKEYMGKYWV